jgi:hypothetical protein
MNGQGSSNGATQLRRLIVGCFRLGCQVLGLLGFLLVRQLATRARLQRALAIDMVVAWRVMDLNKAADPSDDRGIGAVDRPSQQPPAKPEACKL